MEESQLTHYFRELYSPATLLYQISQLSRQQPWLTAASPKHIIAPFGQNISSIPYLSSTQEPPILQNPERVVRHSENERFDRSYQPNVALAPRQTILTKDRETERDSNERSNTVIKRETIQIKQERPSTPNPHELSPELRHNSPETTVVNETSSTNGQQQSQEKPPISPEGQSGSNEITSSTSPVPAMPSIIPNKQDPISPPHHHLPRSHHLHHHTMISSHHLIHKTSTSSNSASPPTVVVKVTTNHQLPLTNGLTKKGVPLIGNPEFELSTDTDDESLGEPDSSNINGSSLTQTAYDYAANLLKTNSTDDHMKVLDLIKYMEKEIVQLKEANKKEIRERQHVEETLRKENERLQSQLNQQHKMTVIANLSSSSSSSSSSLSSNSSYDYERNNGSSEQRRNSVVEKANVIIKPPKKSIPRIQAATVVESDCKPTANSNNNNSSSNSQPPIVLMPKCEDIINNNNTKTFNNNNNSSNNSNGTTTTTVVINGQQTETASASDSSLQKTTIKAEKL